MTHTTLKVPVMSILAVSFHTTIDDKDGDNVFAFSSMGDAVHDLVMIFSDRKNPLGVREANISWLSLEFGKMVNGSPEFIGRGFTVRDISGSPEAISFSENVSISSGTISYMRRLISWRAYIDDLLEKESKNPGHSA